MKNIKYPSISFVIIEKNSESTIDQLLNNIHEYVDEIVVVDSGSEDRTVEIMTKYTSKIFVKKVFGNLAELRNFALKQARCDWILTLDSDEVLPHSSIIKIRQLISEHNCEGFWLKRRFYIKKNTYLKHGLFYPDYQLRLFKNLKNIHYSGAVHEHLNIPLEKTIYSDLEIYHYQVPVKFNSFSNLRMFIFMESNIYREEFGNNRLKLLYTSFYKFLDMFVMGLTRGKGILDGWDGVRAGHFMFASSVFLSYFFAMFPEKTIRKLLKTYE